MKKGAIGIVFSENRSQVLLVKRRDVPVWVLPGGGIEDNEPPEDAVERELFEETGLKVKVVKKVAEYVPINCLASHTYFYECKAESPIPSQLSPQEENQEVAFYPINALPYPFFFLHTEWIEDALQESSAPIVKKMKSVTWRALFSNALLHPILLFRYLLARIGLHINSKSQYDR